MFNRDREHLYIDSQTKTYYRYDNVVLTLQGLIEITNHYKIKYDLDITVFQLNDINELIKNIIQTLKDRIATFPNFQCGFICFDPSLGDYGHATPFIFARKNKQNYFFLLDPTQRFAHTSDYEYKELRDRDSSFRQKLNRAIPMEFWAITGGIQIDGSACTVIASVINRDGLRMDLIESAKHKFTKIVDDIHFFNTPEELLITSQGRSYVELQNIDPYKIVYKNKTLTEFKRSYELPVWVNTNHRFFNLYSHYKGEKYAKLLGERQNYCEMHDYSKEKILTVLGINENVVDRIEFKSEAKINYLRIYFKHNVTDFYEDTILKAIADKNQYLEDDIVSFDNCIKISGDLLEALLNKMNSKVLLVNIKPLPL